MRRRGLRGYTLVEMLMATALTLLMMGGVATVFGVVGESIRNVRATLEMSEALRGAAGVLRSDLSGVTAIRGPTRRPDSGEGYFQYLEGPMGPLAVPGW